MFNGVADKLQVVVVRELVDETVARHGRLNGQKPKR